MCSDAFVGRKPPADIMITVGSDQTGQNQGGGGGAASLLAFCHVIMMCLIVGVVF